MEGNGGDCSLPGAQKQYGWPEAKEAFFLGANLSQEPCGTLQSLRGIDVTSEPPRDTNNILLPWGRLYI